MAFETNYAEFYNLLYQDKDYPKESDYVHRLISLHHQEAGTKPLKVLDLACGTGKHAFELEKMGYDVSGSDISADMIEQARKSAAEKNSGVQFYNHSFQEAHQIENKYEVIVSMFSAIDYLTTYADFSKTMKNIAGLLDDNGIFIFDYWNGNAVVRDYSPYKELTKANETGEIHRISKTELNLVTQTAEVEFTCSYAKGGVKQLEFKELHKMRYFYFKEMEDLLQANGFKIAYRSAFLNDQGQFDSHDWNITIIAQKC